MIKFFTTLILLFIVNALYANDENYADNIKSIINNDIILNSDLRKHELALNVIINAREDRTHKTDVLNDLIKIKLQLEIAEYNKIIPNFKDLLKVYMKFAEKNKLSISQYTTLIKKIGLKPYNIKNFIEDTMTVEKLHEKHLFPKLFASKKDIYNYQFYSNTNDKLNQNIFVVLKIEIKKDTTILKKIKEILKANKKNALKLYEAVTKNKYNTKIYKIDINSKKNTRLTKYIKTNINKNLVGPIYKKNTIFFLKILKKKNKINQYDLNFKIKQCTIKKHIKKNNKNDLKNKYTITKKLNKIRFKLINKDIKTHKYCSDIWINGHDLSDLFYNKIKMLSLNDITNIFEDQDGWHFIQVLEKHFDDNSKISNEIKNQIKTDQLFNLRKNFIKNVKNNAYKITYK